MGNFAKALGVNIKKYRKARGLSQEKLSELIGIQPRQMSKLETGVHFPSGKTLENICITLDVEPKDLFNFDIMEAEENYILDGTYNISNYRVLKSENVYQLLNKQDKTRDILTNNNEKFIEQRFIDMAIKTGETISVEYFENNKYANTIIYYPDGTYKIFDNGKDNTALKTLLKEIVRISNEPEKIDFLKLAIEAFDNPNVIPDLELILKGLKLAGK